MSLTIIEALKKKGSTGGNTIMEAIENLPDNGSGSSGGSVVKLLAEDTTDEYDLHNSILHATYNQIVQRFSEGCLLIVDTEYPEDDGSISVTREYVTGYSAEPGGAPDGVSTIYVCATTHNNFVSLSPDEYMSTKLK